MRKFLTSLLGQSQASKQLTLCKKHIPSDPLIPHSIPYNKD